MASSLPSSMRAIQWSSNAGGIEKHFKLNDSAPLPKSASKLADGQTLVKISHATVNPVDYKITELPLIGRLMFAGTTPGLDYAGTVVTSTLPHLKPGEPVFGALDLPAFGSLAEYAIASKEGCVPLPNDVSPQDAACTGIVGLTAYQSIVPFVKEGDKVFINGGSGGTGTFGIQIAKAMGCHVTTSCSGPNVELCRSLGADEVIDYRTEPVLETLKRKSTQYDFIVDNVFHDTSLYFNAHHYLKPGCKFLTIAGSPSLKGVSDILSVYLTPRWFGGGQRPFVFLTCQPNAEQYAKLAKWMEEKKVKAVIEKVYDLKDSDQAYVRLKSGRTRGKLVVKVTE